MGAEKTRTLTTRQQQEQNPDVLLFHRQKSRLQGAQEGVATGTKAGHKLWEHRRREGRRGVETGDIAL